jgi:hypothetical protein
LVTAYVSDAMQELDEAKGKQFDFHEWNCLDPGVDHMSAMKSHWWIRIKVENAFIWILLWGLVVWIRY